MANATFAAQSTYTVGFFPSSLTVGNFNGDGKPDIAVANFSDNSVFVLLGKGYP
jgi:hypothetical protein